MQIPSQQRKRGLRFNITPMIDVVFLLIIFFLVASHFVRNEEVEAVELPVASSVDDANESPRRLVITITADEKMYVAGKIVTLQQVDTMLLTRNDNVDVTLPGGQQADYEVRIRTDKQVPYRLIEPIMLSCARSSVTNLKFAVIQQR